MEYGLNEKEAKEIEKQLKGNGMSKQKNDWRQDSRKRVDDAARFGNYKSREYRGGLSEDALRTLERAKEIFHLDTPMKELVESAKKDINGNGK